MTKPEILDKLYREGTVKQMLKRYSSTEAQEDLRDLEQDVYIIILQLPEELLVDMYNSGKLRNWISAVLKRQVHSTTSYYYGCYKKLRNKSSELYENTREKSDNED